MKFLKKLKNRVKNRRGNTLVEVLLVVGLMTILLGIAVPDLISESKEIKMTEMNSNARAVAVAVQSKLYGIKNRGTSIGSEYRTLNETAAEVSISTDDGGKDVKYVSNFGEKGTAGKDYLLSGAITDTDLLQKGKIVVVYDPLTADVLEVFYGEKEFPVDDIFPTANESFLKNNNIGLYRGEGSPEPERAISIPRFSLSVGEENEERYLQMQMEGTPDPSIATLPLGLEIYIQFPSFTKTDEWEEMLVYAEGMFDTNYTANYGDSIASDDSGENQLTLDKIANNNKIMRFIIDSAVLEKSASATDYLKHNKHPEIVSVASAPFYPRATINDWMMQSSNPYITYWFRQHATYINENTGGPKEGDSTMSQKLYDHIVALDNNYKSQHTATDYIPINGTCRVRMELHVLSGDTWTEEKNGARIRKYDDDTYAPVNITSALLSPYFNLLDQTTGQISLSSMRALSHLWQVFESENDITTAHLRDDINGDNFYTLLKKLRQALWDELKMTGKTEEDEKKRQDLWGDWAVNQGASVKSCDGNKKFKLDGTTTDGGSHKIQNIIFTGRNGGDASSEPGGLFEYANGCTFTNIDIVNPATLRRNYDPTFLETKDHSITAINESEQWGGASGAFVGFAVNCTFKNVRAYLDDAHHPPALNLSDLTIDGSVVGGLVGVAIGSEGGKTEFTNCAASVRATNGTLDSAMRVVYAGGLVGIAAGNVTISSCYAASQLSGYYSGGLVGATVSGQGNAITWTYKDRKWDLTPREQGPITGTPTITSSFAAGQITRQVRVGGGLIADVQGALPQENVQNCYSAAWWEALAPVSYGTFKGDKKNYYVYQTRFPIPVTENVEAWFNCTGDVLSLQTDVDDGIACTGGDLASKFNDWTKAEVGNTHQWSYNEGSFELHKMYWEKKDTPEAYPFPMPSGYVDQYGAEFWGDWIKTYEEKPTTAGGTPAATPFSSTFLGYKGECS